MHLISLLNIFKYTHTHICVSFYATRPVGEVGWVTSVGEFLFIKLNAWWSECIAHVPVRTPV